MDKITDSFELDNEEGLSGGFIRANIMETQRYSRADSGPDAKKGSPRLPYGLKNFIIDIDGVVCEDIANEQSERMITASEIPGSRKQINKWYEEGHIITFFTARTEQLRDITVEWLKQHGFNYHNIIFGKPRGGAYHYVDDRTVRATKFNGKLGKFVYRKKEIQTFE